MPGFLSRIRSANLSEGSNKSPEQYLWTAVLSTAMYDAIVRKVGAVGGKISLDVEATVDAIIWVLDYDENFKSVCEKAGYDHRYIHKKVIDIVKQRHLECYERSPTYRYRFSITMRRLMLAYDIDPNKYDKICGLKDPNFINTLEGMGIRKPYRKRKKKNEIRQD